MKVYIAIEGIYEYTWPAGVYTSPELAMAAHHQNGVVWTESHHLGAEDHEPKYQKLYGPRYRTWTNNKDWQAAVEIIEVDLVEDGPRREPDKRLQEVYRGYDKASGWEPIQ